MRSTLILYAADGSGSREFAREAKKIALQYDGTLVPIYCKGKNKRERRAQVVSALSLYGSGEVERLVILCHGWPGSIQFGFGLKNETADMLALYINWVTSADAIVFFGCCSVSRNPGLPLTHRWRPSSDAIANIESYADKSFARTVAILSSRRVIGHYTAGHTTRNPFIVEHGYLGSTSWGHGFIPYSNKWHGNKVTLKQSIESGDYFILLGLAR